MRFSINVTPKNLGATGMLVIAGSLVAAVATPHRYRRSRDVAQIGAAIGSGLVAAALARPDLTDKEVYQLGVEAGRRQGRMIAKPVVLPTLQSSDEEMYRRGVEAGRRHGRRATEHGTSPTSQPKPGNPADTTKRATS